MTKLGKELGVNIVCAQTNYEGEMCELVSSPPPALVRPCPPERSAFRFWR